MAQIIIHVPDDKAREIEAHRRIHQRMLITGTVPALHNWTIPTDDITIEIEAE